MPRISVIVPTYCEAANLTELATRLFAALTHEFGDAELIVVDDNSPDETVSVCDQLAQEFPLRLIVRKNERGLSSAVIAGMRAARGELFIVMDGDLSHPPESVPELVAALEDPRTDFVIGSRYVRGGSTDESWGFFRYLNSRFATSLAAPLTKTADPMAGFFGLRRETFDLAAELNPIGYKIGLELMVKCGCVNTVEVPIHFANRKQGTSKLSLREQLNYLRHLVRLYSFRWRRGTPQPSPIHSVVKELRSASCQAHREFPERSEAPRNRAVESPVV
jgi:dolichol-phosphate mannosyltransferase